MQLWIYKDRKITLGWSICIELHCSEWPWKLNDCGFCGLLMLNLGFISYWVLIVTSKKSPAEFLFFVQEKHIVMNCLRWHNGDLSLVRDSTGRLSQVHGADSHGPLMIYNICFLLIGPYSRHTTPLRKQPDTSKDQYWLWAIWNY